MISDKFFLQEAATSLQRTTSLPSLPAQSGGSLRGRSWRARKKKKKANLRVAFDLGHHHVSCLLLGRSMWLTRPLKRGKRVTQRAL